jgi:hypothetical protein
MKTKSHRRTFLKRGVLLGSGLWLASLASSRATTENPPVAEANIWEVFKQRRSVRKFRPDVIPEKDIGKSKRAVNGSKTGRSSTSAYVCCQTRVWPHFQLKLWVLRQGTVQKQLRHFWLDLLAAGFVARSLQTHWRGMRVARASPTTKSSAS